MGAGEQDVKQPTQSALTSLPVCSDKGHIDIHVVVRLAWDHYHGVVTIYLWLLPNTITIPVNNVHGKYQERKVTHDFASDRSG